MALSAEVLARGPLEGSRSLLAAAHRRRAQKPPARPAPPPVVTPSPPAAPTPSDILARLRAPIGSPGGFATQAEWQAARQQFQQAATAGVPAFVQAAGGVFLPQPGGQVRALLPGPAGTVTEVAAPVGGLQRAVAAALPAAPSGTGGAVVPGGTAGTGTAVAAPAAGAGAPTAPGLSPEVRQLVQEALALLSQPVEAPAVPSELPAAFGQMLERERQARLLQIQRALEDAVAQARAAAAASGGPGSFLLEQEQRSALEAGTERARLEAGLAFQEQQFRAELAQQARAEAAQRQLERRERALALMNAAGMLSDADFRAAQLALEQERTRLAREDALARLELQRGIALGEIGGRPTLEARQLAAAGRLTPDQAVRQDLLARWRRGERLTADERAFLGLPAEERPLTAQEIRVLAAQQALRDPRLTLQDRLGNPLFTLDQLTREWIAFFSGGPLPAAAGGVSGGAMAGAGPTAGGGTAGIPPQVTPDVVAQLRVFVQELQAAGLTPDEVAQRLRNLGWPEDVIRQVLRDAGAAIPGGTRE